MTEYKFMQNGSIWVWDSQKRIAAYVKPSYIWHVDNWTNEYRAREAIKKGNYEQFEKLKNLKII